MEVDKNGLTMEVATDGACMDNGYANARTGAGIFVDEAHGLNQSIRPPRSIEQSNQTGEAVATLTAATIPDPRTRITQVTDSKTVMKSLTTWRQKHEDSGYNLQGNSTLTQATLVRLKTSR